jgi:hypothetical protein
MVEEAMALMTSRRDVSGRLVAAGRYMLTQPGKRPTLVQIIEDDSTDLWIQSQPDGSNGTASQRIEELAEDVQFHLVGGALVGGFVDVPDVQGLLQTAADLRQGLRVCEDELCHLLGCQTADGTELADAIQSAVRDGVGSAFELVALRG